MAVPTHRVIRSCGLSGNHVLTDSAVMNMRLRQHSCKAVQASIMQQHCYSSSLKRQCKPVSRKDFVRRASKQGNQSRCFKFQSRKQWWPLVTNKDIEKYTPSSRKINHLLPQLSDPESGWETTQRYSALQCNQSRGKRSSRGQLCSLLQVHTRLIGGQARLGKQDNTRPRGAALSL